MFLHTLAKFAIAGIAIALIVTLVIGIWTHVGDTFDTLVFG